MMGNQTLSFSHFAHARLQGAELAVMLLGSLIVMTRISHKFCLLGLGQRVQETWGQVLLTDPLCGEEKTSVSEKTLACVCTRRG